MAENDVDGVGIIMSDLAIRYQAEAFHRQTLQFEIALGDPTKRSCDMLYRVTETESGRLVATAKTGLVFFDYGQKKVAAMPQRFAKLLQN
jgi:4-hydroxybenzoyl-CoA thioesterase